MQKDCSYDLSRNISGRTDPARDRTSLIGVRIVFGERFPFRLSPSVPAFGQAGRLPSLWGGRHYYRFGKDKGAQRFKCKDCGPTFTEYTGTWQEGLHKRELAGLYLGLMADQKSLDKIPAALHINKKTAFDWCHKILGALKRDKGGSFSGIVESDDAFFEESEKGSCHLKRPPRERGADQKAGAYRTTRLRL